MVEDIRKTEVAIGSSSFNLSKSSNKNLNSKRSIYVSKDIHKGETITQYNIKVIRPGFGLHPKYYKSILGKKSKKNLKFGARFKLEYIYKK